MSTNYTIEQVALHNSETDIWIVVDNQVFDLTKFVSSHPGGKKILVKCAGTDASEQFWNFHARSVLTKTAAPFKIGQLGDANSSLEDDKDVEQDTEYFGDLIPFGDPFHYQGFASPYYNATHHAVRADMRKFTDENLMKGGEWDEAGEIPAEVYKKVAAHGILAATVAGESLEHYADDLVLPGKVAAKDYDPFHNFIVIDELSRSASGGVLYGLVGGFGIGLPPVIHFGTKALKDKIIPACLRGEERICLAITEPGGGSDVANLTTTAIKTECGRFYKVSGEKKWITGGIHSRYFTTAVRTGGKGFGGISLVVIERTEGVKTIKMRCSGVICSGTSYITFEDVLVPVGNLLGEENKGFALIMANFNPERIGIAMQANRFARVCLEESIVYASKRKVFGMLLRDQPVIRNKFAHMSRMIESTHAWIESILYQATKFSAEEMTARAGGAIALLKAQATTTFEYCVTKFGQGEKVERLYREAKAYSIPGGSTELMLDLGIRQSIKIAQIMGVKL